MLLNRKFHVPLVVAILFSGTAYARSGGIGCPQNFHGHKLNYAGVFEGPPSDHADIMPQRGGYFNLNDPLARASSYFALGCGYENTKEMVTIVLPRTIRECLFLKKSPQLACD